MKAREDIRKALHVNPFRPFSITMTDGKVYRIRSPDNVAIAPPGSRESLIAVPSGDSRKMLDAWDIMAVHEEEDVSSIARRMPIIWAT